MIKNIFWFTVLVSGCQTSYTSDKFCILMEKRIVNGKLQDMYIDNHERCK